MGKLHIKSDLSHAIEAFNTHDRVIPIRLDKEQISMLMAMIGQFQIQLSKGDLELEAIIFREVQRILWKKYNIISTRANIDFTPSQARTLFIWMNDFTFDHPLQQSFSCKLISEIYKQVI